LKLARTAVTLSGSFFDGEPVRLGLLDYLSSNKQRERG
jgi:hypothetical protein